MKTFLLVVLFCATVASTVQASICPPPSLIRPCTCDKPWYSEDIYLVCDRVLTQDVLLKVLERSSDYAYNKFELRYSSIMYLPVSALHIKNLTRIIISSSTLVSLFDFPPPEDNVVDKVELDKARIYRGLKWEQFRTLHKLRELKVRDVPIKSLGKKFADNMPQGTEIVNFYDTGVSILEDGVLARLEELKDVAFQGGRLKDLKRSMFPSPAKITDFDFSRNQISSLPADLFTDMPDLKSITFDNNLMTQVPENVFRQVLAQLDYLYIYGNPLQCRCYIRWMLEADWGHVYVSGRCEEPAELYGRNLKTLVEGDFRHCE